MIKKIETKYYESDDMSKSFAFRKNLYLGGFYASVSYSFYLVTPTDLKFFWQNNLYPAQIHMYREILYM